MPILYHPPHGGNRGHLSDHVFPRLAVRQWVFSLPKRLRYHLERDPNVVSAVLRIFLRAVETHLRWQCPEASERARFGAVSFVHRFGSSLNRHLHFHCCVIDGVFDPAEYGKARFHPARATTPAQVEALPEQLRHRVLRRFSRSGILDPGAANGMLDWANGGGFSLDASARIGADDRAGLERLLRYCARPTFALDRLREAGPDKIVYRLPKPAMDGRTELILTPLEFLDRIAALIPPPRRHRHRYHGVLAPNSPLRQAVTAYRQPGLKPEPIEPAPNLERAPDPAAAPEESSRRSPARYLWAVLLARLFETFPLECPRCGGEMRLVAFVTEGATIRRILVHVGEPTQAPAPKLARGPPDWDLEPEPGLVWEGQISPEPEFEFEFDQWISW